MITNREIATVVWLVIFLVVSSTKAEVRASFSSLARAFFRIKIVVPLLLFAGWLASWVWLADKAGLWEPYLLKDTATWFAVSGLVLLMNANRVAEDEQYVRSTIRSTFQVSVILGFFLNIITFSLIVEFLLLPIMAFLVMATTLAERDVQLARSKRLFEVLLAGITGALVILTAVDIYRQRHDLDLGELWRSFAMTVWLPVVALPFVSGFALIASYELVFMRLGFANDRRRVGLKTRLAIVLGLNGQLRDVNAFTGGWARQVAEAPTFRIALQRVRSFRQHRVKQHLEERERQDRLKRYAEIDGTDAEGKRLDQRGFAETKEALRWLATCHMGWYRNRGGRYHPNLLERLGGFSSKGLPEEHGIMMEGRGDGQAWYAWRRTVSGWVFAIGAAAKPPDQWLYDGADPPTGFPGSAKGWDHFVPAGAAKNWSDP